MPQELHVVRCYACNKFQVQIVKKVPKWQCKVCNEKQSLLKVYAQGSGKDCRQYVQELNMKQGLLMSSEPQVESSFDHENHSSVIPGSDYVSNSPQASKWSNYLEYTGSSDISGHSASDDRDDYNGSNKLRLTLSNQKRKLDPLLNCESDDFNHVDGHPQEVYNYLEDSYDAGTLKFSKSTGSQVEKSMSIFPTQGTSAGASRSQKSKWSQFVTHNEGGSFNSRSQDRSNVEDTNYDVSEGNDSICANTGLMRSGKMLDKFGSERTSEVDVQSKMRITDDGPFNSCHSVERASEDENYPSVTSAILNLTRKNGGSEWSQFVSHNEESHHPSSQEDNFDLSATQSERLNPERSENLFPSTHSVPPTKRVQKVFGHTQETLTVKNSFGTKTDSSSLSDISNSKCQANIESGLQYKNPFCNTDDENLDSILDF